MFAKSAKYYDLIYSSFKDYRAESETIASLIRRLHPSAATILDVACGTAEHARFLTENHQYKVDGIDLDDSLLEIARQKLPQAQFEIADMIKFDLEKRYDVVTCLFSSIGYVQTLANVVATLQCFRRHLSPEGVIIVEPWFSPDKWEPGRIYMKTADLNDLKVCRMSSSNREGSLSKLRFEYLIGSAEGIFHEIEDHVLGLFTVDEMKQCFEKAGLIADFDPQGIFGRGLYVARERA